MQGDKRVKYHPRHRSSLHTFMIPFAGHDGDTVRKCRPHVHALLRFWLPICLALWLLPAHGASDACTSGADPTLPTRVGVLKLNPPTQQQCLAEVAALPSKAFVPLHGERLRITAQRPLWLRGTELSGLTWHAGEDAGRGGGE